MTADKQSAAPPVEREKFEAWYGKHPHPAATNASEDEIIQLVKSAAWIAWQARAASAPIPAGQTLSAQPVASPNDADRKLIRAQALEEAAKEAGRYAKNAAHNDGAYVALTRCAAAIRALALPSVPGEKP